MAESDFRPHSSETPQPIFMKLEIYNYFPDTTPHAKFQGAMSTWVVWASLTHESSFLLFVSSPGATGRIFGHTPAQYVIIRRSGQGSAFWGLKR